MNARRARAAGPDLLAAILLLAGVFLFLFPVLHLDVPAAFCDAPVESVPRVVALARMIQSGGLPLWDFHTFAGARPFYVTNESAIFYPLAYPFYWGAPLDDTTAATVLLVLLPYVLHLLWAALGAYVFARMALRVRPLGAFVCGWLWALSPEMGVQIHTPDVAYLFAWLPWALLAVTRFVEAGAHRWWIAGSLALGLLASVGTPNFIVRTFFVAAATGTTLWLMGFAGERRWRRLAALAAMFAVALGLNSFAWAGVLEGIGWMRAQLGPLTHESASDMWAESSMPPAYLAALFVPSLFGVLDNRHAWGIALEEGVTNLSALSGGLALACAAFAALAFALLQRGESDRRLRRWVWLALAIQAIALATMMGRYTPIFEWLCAVLPWFFRIPHAVYYRFAQCWSAAVLAAIGVSVLLSHPPFRDRVGRLRLPIAALAVATAALAWPLWAPKPDEDTYIPAYKHLSDLGEEMWFVTDPLLYFGLAAGMLLAAFIVLPRRARPWALAVLICGEALYFAKPVFYDALLFEQTREPPDLAVQIQDERYRTAADHPHAAVGRRASELGRERDVRFVGYNSRFDNQAWLWDGRALLGYSSKPLEPRFRESIEPLVEGMPYDLMFREPPARVGSEALTFLRNLNVGMVVGRLDRPPTWMHQTHDLEIHAIADPLPYAYFHDGVVELDAAEQLRRLRTTDLRRAVYVEPGSEVPLHRQRDAGPGVLSDAEHRRFTALQATHRVLRTDRSRANRQVVEIETPGPALLVLTETWHEGWTAALDGRPTNVWRVNAFLQGIVVGGGRQRIELRFAPPRLRWGLAATAMSAAWIAGVALWAWRLRRSQRFAL